MTSRSSSSPLLTPSTFVGTWSVRRKIVDYLAATTALFTGRATITSTRFEETGHLVLGPTRVNATRTYHLRSTPRSVIVTRPDGSDFITLDLQPSQTVQHSCGADLYVGRFFFVDTDTWAETWRVVGPRKHYVSLSHYRRLPR